MFKNTYYAADDGFVDGTWRDRGEPVQMAAGAARYHLLQGSLLETKPESEKLAVSKPKEIVNAGDAKPDKGGN